MTRKTLEYLGEAIERTTRARQMILAVILAALLALLLWSEPSHATVIQPELSCGIVCKPLHPKPKVKVFSHRPDLMCYEFIVTLTLQMPESIPLSLELPPDIMPPDVDDTPEPEPQSPPLPVVPAVYTVIGDAPPVGFWGWTGDAPRGVRASYGSPGLHPAPEVDPGSALSAISLLGGALAVMRGRK